MDQHLAQVAVATFANPKQLWLAAGCHLFWHQPHPGCQVTSPIEAEIIDQQPGTRAEPDSLPSEQRLEV